jgi:hypothetical protein
MTKIEPKKSNFDSNKKTYKQRQTKYKSKRKFQKTQKKTKQCLKLFSMPKVHFLKNRKKTERVSFKLT